MECGCVVFSLENRNDINWLRTALAKGSLEDRVKAGSLIIAANPEGSLETLDTLIEFTRSSHKFNKNVLRMLKELWLEILMPQTRRLYDLDARSKFWRGVCDLNVPNDDTRQRRLLAYWFFENELKAKYEG